MVKLVLGEFKARAQAMSVALIDIGGGSPRSGPQGLLLENSRPKRRAMMSVRV